MTDHYHQYAVPIAQQAWIMSNGQCKHLDGLQDPRTLLKAQYLTR